MDDFTGPGLPRIRTAELLSIGSELTNGETRDTNAGELARSLTDAGVLVQRMTALPDRREDVEAAFRDAFARSDLVVSTGGLGPTPDDLTRESIAAVCGETPVVDPGLEAWLRDLWARRGMPFAEINLKQAWLIPSAMALPNPNGTAPGWLVERPTGRLAVLLPGPPREMRPMWRDQVIPRLQGRGLGEDRAVRILRLFGIGESAVADVVGEEILRRPNPTVATYARADAVDVRLSAVSEAGAPGAASVSISADQLLDAVEPVVVALLGNHVWARGETTWPEALGAELGRLGWTVAIREIGAGGALIALLGPARWLARAEIVPRPLRGTGPIRLLAEARAVGGVAAAPVGLALSVRQSGRDTAVAVAIAMPGGSIQRRSLAFQGGEHGRSRAALFAASVLLEVLRAR